MDDIVLSFDSNKKEELDLVKEDKVERSVIDSFDESSLSESERKMVEDFSKEIDIGNSQLVLEYGAGVQKKMSDFSDSTLSVIRTKDLGEVGDMISNLVVELKGFYASDEDKGILGFFKRGSKKTQLMRANYDKAENNVNSIVKSLENQQVTLMKDISTLATANTSRWPECGRKRCARPARSVIFTSVSALPVSTPGCARSTRCVRMRRCQLRSSSSVGQAEAS